MASIEEKRAFLRKSRENSRIKKFVAEGSKPKPDSAPKKETTTEEKIAFLQAKATAFQKLKKAEAFKGKPRLQPVADFGFGLGMGATFGAPNLIPAVKKEYDKAKIRSPKATTLGEVSSFFIPGAGQAKALKLGAKATKLIKPAKLLAKGRVAKKIAQAATSADRAGKTAKAIKASFKVNKRLATKQLAKMSKKEFSTLASKSTKGLGEKLLEKGTEGGLAGLLTGSVRGATETGKIDLKRGLKEGAKEAAFGAVADIGLSAAGAGLSKFAKSNLGRIYNARKYKKAGFELDDIKELGLEGPVHKVQEKAQDIIDVIIKKTDDNIAKVLEKQTFGDPNKIANMVIGKDGVMKLKPAKWTGKTMLIQPKNKNLQKYIEDQAIKKGSTKYTATQFFIDAMDDIQAGKKLALDVTEKKAATNMLEKMYEGFGSEDLTGELDLKKLIKLKDQIGKIAFNKTTSLTEASERMKSKTAKVLWLKIADKINEVIPQNKEPFNRVHRLITAMEVAEDALSTKKPDIASLQNLVKNSLLTGQGVQATEKLGEIAGSRATKGGTFRSLGKIFSDKEEKK